MAITGTALTTGSTTTDGVGPFTTASITPSANQPVIVDVLFTVGSGQTPTASVSGCGLAWTLLTQTASGARTLFKFLGVGPSPTTGVLSFSGDGSTTISSCLWVVSQAAGVATAVNNGVVQVVNAKPASSTSASVAFASTVTSGNATFGALAVAAAQNPTAGTGWTSMGATNQTAPTSGLLGEFAATGQQNITATQATAANWFATGVELAAATTGGGTDASVSGPVARVTATAPAGTVTASGGTVTVRGPVATVQASAPAGSVSIVKPSVSPPITLTWPIPDWFITAVRSSYGLTYTVDAFYGNTAVAGATGLQPIGGSITDTIKPGVRRTLSLDLAGDRNLYDLLAPTGTALKVTGHITLSSQQVVNVPMGTFIIDQVTLGEGGGKISITAPDRWVLLQRAKFIGPVSSSVGIPVVDQMVQLIQGGLGGAEPVSVLSSSTATMDPLTWKQDRDKAIQDLATSIGAWVYVDRYGVFTIADVPTISTKAGWLLDASTSGVLISLDRSKSRTSTYNVVVVDSSSSTDQGWPTQYAWDSDAASPTYAGPDPVRNPELAGQFGIAAYPYSDPNISTAGEALTAARAILAHTIGIASSVTVTATPNCAVDAFDPVDVLPPGRVSGRRPAAGGSPAVSWSYGPDTFMERHIADTVTHPLDPSQPLQIAGRSTRTDPYT